MGDLVERRAIPLYRYRYSNIFHGSFLSDADVSIETNKNLTRITIQNDTRVSQQDVLVRCSIRMPSASAKTSQQEGVGNIVKVRYTDIATSSFGKWGVCYN